MQTSATAQYDEEAVEIKETSFAAATLTRDIFAGNSGYFT